MWPRACERRFAVTGLAIGLGGAGVPVGLMGYNAYPYATTGHIRDIFAWVLIGSAGSCGAGLSRLFRSKRGETSGS